MNRILALQKMEPTGIDGLGKEADVLMDSTSSYETCVCSSTSYGGGCTVTEGFAL